MLVSLVIVVKKCQTASLHPSFLTVAYVRVCTSTQQGPCVWSSAAASGQSSMRRGTHSSNRLEIKLGMEASGAPQAPAQAPQKPAAAQQPLAPPIAAFSGEDVKAEPVQEKPDVDMEEI